MAGQDEGAGGVRELPKNVEAEQLLLGCCLLYQGEGVPFAVEALKAADFYLQKHRVIFRALVQMFAEGEPIDVILLANYLEAQGEMERAGGRLYLNELLSRGASVTALEYYAKVIRDKAMRRSLIEAGGIIAERGYDEQSPVAELVDASESEIFDIANRGTSRTFVSAESFFVEHIGELEARHKDPGRCVGVRTHFARLDGLTGGLMPSDLIVVAGRPGTGKSSLVLAFARNMLTKSQGTIGFFSLEMSKEQVLERLLTGESGTDLHKMRTGFLETKDWREIVSAVPRLRLGSMLIDDSPGATVVDIRARARRMCAQYPDLRMILVDYLQLMEAGVKTPSREQEVAYITRSLKKLARELNLPVVAVSQLSREVEKRDSKRPRLSDLRECVTGETRVMLADGRRVSISDLTGKSPEVLAVSEAGSVVRAQSDAVWPVGVRPVFKITTSSGRFIRVTARHRFLTGRGWRRIESMAVGERMAMARVAPEPSAPEVWEEEKVILLGHLVGDGSYLTHRPLRYTTSSEENSEAVVTAALRGFGCESTRHAGRGNWHQLVIKGNGNRWHRAGVNAWLRELGIWNQRSHEKHLPGAVFCLRNDQIALLLRHLWATDGCIWVSPSGITPERARVYFATCSRALVEDVAALLLRFRIVGRIRTVASKGSTLYTVDVSGSPDQRRFLEFVGAFGPRVDNARRLEDMLARTSVNTNIDTLPKEIFSRVRAVMVAKGITTRAMASARGTAYGGSAHFKFAPSRSTILDYARILNDAELRRAATDDLFWDTIVSIEPDGEEQVYDLTVPGPASWLADGLVNHNSGAIEQDADVVLFVYRGDSQDGPPEDGRVRDGVPAEVIVAKQRNGPPGAVKVVFIKRSATFYEAVSEEGVSDVE